MTKNPKTKPFKFPMPHDYRSKDPAVLCPRDRVLVLYNQTHPDAPAQRIGKTVRHWFAQAAHDHGWAGVRFLPEVQTRNTAGAILGAPASDTRLIIVEIQVDEIQVDEIQVGEIQSGEIQSGEIQGG